MKYKTTNFNITLAGMMFSLVIIFQYLERFMPLIPHFININLALVFIVPILFLSGYWWAFILLILRLIISPALSPLGYSSIGILGSFIGFIASFLFITLLFFGKKLKPIKNKYGMYIGLLLIIIITSLIMATLNGFLFVPWYNYLFSNTFSLTFQSQWGLENYWAIVFSIFLTGNIINFSITSFIAILVLKVVKPKLINKN